MEQMLEIDLYSRQTFTARNLNPETFSRNESKDSKKKRNRGSLGTIIHRESI